MATKIAWCKGCGRFEEGTAGSLGFTCALCGQFEKAIVYFDDQACPLCGDDWDKTGTYAWSCKNFACDGYVLANTLSGSAAMQWVRDPFDLDLSNGLPASIPVRIYLGCVSCGIELSRDLDAYWGRRPDGKDHCEPCRRRLGGF